MGLQLATSAEYLPESDIVFAHAWLYAPGTTPDGDVFKPQAVTVGKAELLNRNLQVIASLTFDATNGNSDGGFHLAFIHPADYRDLVVRFTVTTDQLGSFLSEAPVKAQAPSKTRLEGQPDL